MSENQKNHSFFEKHSSITLVLVLIIAVLFLSVVTEVIMRYQMGLGNPLLVDSNPFYGYRAQPDQSLKRFGNSEIRINNLGLRADRDWNSIKKNKILFLGDSVTYGGSYVSNEELFSTLAGAHVRGYEIGNAGTNGWGVENIYGLIVKTNFTPARIYITVLPEEDFYRGLVRLQGLPFWTLKPSSAFQELFLFFCYKQNNIRYRHWSVFTDRKTTLAVIDQATRQLKETDLFLKKKGYLHRIYITPKRSQLLAGGVRDGDVLASLRTHNLKAVYILDRIRNLNPDPDKIFFDKIHLTREGHQLWGSLIGRDLSIITRTGNIK